mmetsp:Transcript_254/g.590  ORF Transcript_254/g.590 Transcript_254/m.590 type:complete len:220 (+) Transcript_254:317-976(+)
MVQPHRARWCRETVGIIRSTQRRLPPHRPGTAASTLTTTPAQPLKPEWLPVQRQTSRVHAPAPWPHRPTKLPHPRICQAAAQSKSPETWGLASRACWLPYQPQAELPPRMHPCTSTTAFKPTSTTLHPLCPTNKQHKHHDHPHDGAPSPPPIPLCHHYHYHRCTNTQSSPPHRSITQAKPPPKATARPRPHTRARGHTVRPHSVLAHSGCAAARLGQRG